MDEQWQHFFWHILYTRLSFFILNTQKLPQTWRLGILGLVRSDVHRLHLESDGALGSKRGGAVASGTPLPWRQMGRYLGGALSGMGELTFSLGFPSASQHLVFLKICVKRMAYVSVFLWIMVEPQKEVWWGGCQMMGKLTLGERPYRKKELLWQYSHVGIAFVPPSHRLELISFWFCF